MIAGDQNWVHARRTRNPTRAANHTASAAGTRPQTFPPAHIHRDVAIRANANDAPAMGPAPNSQELSHSVHRCKVMVIASARRIPATRAATEAQTGSTWPRRPTVRSTSSPAPIGFWKSQSAPAEAKLMITASTTRRTGVCTSFTGETVSVEGDSLHASGETQRTLKHA